MRVSRTTPTLHGFGWAVRRTAALVRETFLLLAPIVALEWAGRHSPHDGTDLIVLCGVIAVGYLLTQAARSGWMPGTVHAVHGLKEAGLRLVRAISPRYALAFRPTAEVVPVPDRTLLLPIAVLVTALVATAILGQRVLDALLFVKTNVSYTLYLLGLSIVWSLLFVAIVAGALVAAQWLQLLSRQRGLGFLPIVFAVAWVGGLMTVLLLPGSTPLAILLVLGAWRARSIGQTPTQRYLFCRRDAQGRPRTMPVHIYLHRLHACIVLLLAVIVALGQSRRLWLPLGPETPFTFTTWLGVLATLCSLILVVRAGFYFQRSVGKRDGVPETPLTPTLWIRDVEAHREPWQRIAREGGWLALVQPEVPEHEFDLVMGDVSSPRRFLPREPVNDEDARFLLERRFHVVMRRRFHRNFQSLYKQLKAETPTDGSGYLFCPHVWLVPGVIRDVEPKSPTGRRGGGLQGPAFYGVPYRDAFPLRVRRYIGSVLRELQIDIVYWEDAVGWPDLRRVLGVAFEIYDQGRAPLEARHFIGLPRVRIVIQEEEADPDPTGDPLRPRKPTLQKKAPGHSRILLIVRDRGEFEELDVPDPVDSWIKTPSLV